MTRTLARGSYLAGTIIVPHFTQRRAMIVRSGVVRFLPPLTHQRTRPTAGGDP
jgi:hypothetical protein